MDPQLSGLALILTGYQSFTAPPNHRNNRYFRHKAALSEELSSTSFKSPFYLKPNFKTLLVGIVNEYSFYLSRLVPHFLNLLVFGTSTSSKMYVAFHSRKFYKRNETKCLRIRGQVFNLENQFWTMALRLYRLSQKKSLPKITQNGYVASFMKKMITFVNLNPPKGEVIFAIYS